jgi:hypothetical protein
VLQIQGEECRWATILIMLWPPLHVTGLFILGSEIPEVIGAVLQAIGFAVSQ